MVQTHVIWLQNLLATLVETRVRKQKSTKMNILTFFSRHYQQIHNLWANLEARLEAVAEVEILQSSTFYLKKTVCITFIVRRRRNGENLNFTKFSHARQKSSLNTLLWSGGPDISKHITIWGLAGRKKSSVLLTKIVYIDKCFLLSLINRYPKLFKNAKMISKNLV